MSSAWLWGVLLATIAAGPAAAQFTPGNIVVERLGDGSAALTSAATPVFLDQFDPITPGQTTPSLTVALPTTVGTVGGPLAVTTSGTATSEGYFTRTTNGLALVVPGYNASVGTTGVASTAPTATFRSIGIVSDTGSVNSTNGFNNGPSGNIRGLASVDASSTYITTNAGVFLKTSTGTVENATQIAANNSRAVNIFNNSLFISTSSATAANNGVFLVGDVGTLPTGTATATQLPGLGTSGTGTPSGFGFALFNNPLNTNNWNGTGLNTMYVADDRATASGGGIQRWVFDGSAWTMTENVAPGTGGLRGLTGSIAGNTVTLYGTTTETNANSIVSVTDTLTPMAGSFGAFSTLATAPTNTVFRGVAFSPVPEPSAVLAVCGAACGVVAGLRRWRRRVAYSAW